MLADMGPSLPIQSDPAPSDHKQPAGTNQADTYSARWAPGTNKTPAAASCTALESQPQRTDTNSQAACDYSSEERRIPLEQLLGRKLLSERTLDTHVGLSDVADLTSFRTASAMASSKLREVESREHKGTDPSGLEHEREGTTSAAEGICLEGRDFVGCPV